VSVALPLPRGLPRSLLLAAALVALWAAATWMAWDLPLNNDVSWQYWVARQLRGGAMLYRDMLESNPPLWFWEAVPASSLADRLGIDASHVAIAGVMALNVVVIGLCRAALPPGERGVALIGLAGVLFGLPLFDFGERDHLMAVATLPYVLLAARRGEGLSVSRELAIGTGLVAASGVALKPHFLLLPLALEAWLAIRRDWRLIRVETIALMAALLAYVAVVALATPAYFTHELPAVFAAYGEFKPPFATLWTEQIYLPGWLLAGAALALGWSNASPRTHACGVAALAFIACYAAQAKGFPYQALPATMASALAAWLLLVERHRRAAGYSAAAAIGWAAFCAIMIGAFSPMRLGAITERLETLPAGSTVAVVSAHSWNAFPLVEDRHFIWPMRGLLLWQFPAIARTGPNTPLARETRASIVDDLWCHPPDAILFDDPARSPAMPRNGFDYRRFVAADPRAAKLLAVYRDAARVGQATLLLRMRAIPPRGAGCRAISVRPDLP
jgi:hypothetical protein